MNSFDRWGTDGSDDGSDSGSGGTDCASQFADASQPYDPNSPCSGTVATGCPSSDMMMGFAQSSLAATFYAQAQAMGCAQAGPSEVAQQPPSPVCYDWACMPAAFARAIQAISFNTGCMDLFGTAQTRSNGFSPIKVLSNIVYGSHSMGRISFSTHTLDWGVAQTRPAGLFPIPGLAGRVSISINQILGGYGFWNEGNITQNAETLLHELGHAFNDLRGAGGFALPNSAENNDPYAFDNVINVLCFPGL